MQSWHQRSTGGHAACQELKKRWKLALYPYCPAQMLVVTLRRKKVRLTTKVRWA